MAGKEYYRSNQGIESRETRDERDVERSKASYDPRTAGRTADRPGRPKRKDYGEGLAGDAAFTKAERAYRRGIQEDALNSR